jgi:hypothetical protein
MIRLEFPPAIAGTRLARVPGRLITELRLWQPGGSAAYTTGDAESAAVILHGTFDLVGNGTAWPARGARRTEYDGRPMAVFLPPRADCRADGPVGEIAIVAARQLVKVEDPQGRAALSHKPLLPMAGSGKAFDPTSGEWRPAETFPTAAESLPPRRMQQLRVGAVTVERVLAADYKAATLSIDEAVLPPGTELQLGAIDGRPPAQEVLLLLRTEGQLSLGDAVTGAVQHAPTELEHAWLLSADEFAATRLRADRGRGYVLIAYAGK